VERVSLRLADRGGESRSESSEVGDGAGEDGGLHREYYILGVPKTGLFVFSGWCWNECGAVLISKRMNGGRSLCVENDDDAMEVKGAKWMGTESYTEGWVPE